MATALVVTVPGAVGSINVRVESIQAAAYDPAVGVTCFGVASAAITVTSTSTAIEVLECADVDPTGWDIVGDPFADEPVGLW